MTMDYFERKELLDKLQNIRIEAELNNKINPETVSVIADALYVLIRECTSVVRY